MPVYWAVIVMLILKAERRGFESHLPLTWQVSKLFYISSFPSYEMKIIYSTYSLMLLLQFSRPQYSINMFNQVPST